MKQKNKQSNPTRYFTKWFLLMTVIFAMGTALAFIGVNLIRSGATGEFYFNPITLILLPIVMLVLVSPFAIFMLRKFRKHFDTFSKAMNFVANGETDVAITEDHGAFKEIYKDFNKMVAEIHGIQKLRDELTGSFSHELKTPISSITGFAKMLLEEDLSEKKRKEYLAIILKESERVANLANHNLFLTKIGTQEIITGKVQYNLGKQIQNIAIAMESIWGKKNIMIDAELPDITYDGNPDLMESLWQNLLSNAIKFTPKNGEIDIKLSETESNIIVKFTDTGIGMSDEVQARIFDRFYQGDQSHAVEGHGLGLAIVHRIVQMCDGEITVTSAEGEGSTFTVTLPKSQQKG